MSLVRNIYIELSDVVRFRYVVLMSVISTLKVRYRYSFLGFFWSLMGPALSYGTLAFVFYYGARLQIENYYSYVFPGIALFSFFSQSIINGTSSMIRAEGFIKKIYLPKTIYVFNTTFADLANFILAFSTLVILGIITKQFTPNLYWLITIPSIMLCMLFVTGLSCILGVMAVFMRDLTHMVPILMQMAFYLTPILYRIQDMPEKARKIIMLNPFSHYVELIRYPFLHSSPPPINEILICSAVSMITFTLGLITIKKYDNRIIFRL